MSLENGVTPWGLLTASFRMGGSVACSSIRSDNWKIHVTISVLLWLKACDWIMSPDDTSQTPSNSLSVLWGHPQNSILLSILVDSFSCWNTCHPFAFPQYVPILPSPPPLLLWQPLPLAFHWHHNSFLSHPLHVMPASVHLRSLWQCISNYFSTSVCLPSVCLSSYRCQSLKFIVAKNIFLIHFITSSYFRVPQMHCCDFPLSLTLYLQATAKS